MRKLAGLFLFFFLLYSNLFGQDTLFLNTDGKITMPQFASYYRVADYDLGLGTPKGSFTDYFAKSGRVFAKGQYIKGVRQGTFDVFGITEKKSFSMVFGKDWKLLKLIIYQVNGKDTAIEFGFDQQKLVIDKWRDSGNRSFLSNGSGMINFSSGNLHVKGKVVKGLPDSLWIMKNSGYEVQEYFKDGKFMSGEGRRANGKPFKTRASGLLNLFVNFTYFSNAENLVVSNFYRRRDYPKLDVIFQHPEDKTRIHDSTAVSANKEPEFPGGNASLGKYFKKVFKYPEQARQHHINGVVMVEFTIDKNGQVMNPKIVKGLGYGCDEEALKMVKNMPDWIPGKKNGIPVSILYKMPIRFGE